jgi:hypothetical protein
MYLEIKIKRKKEEIEELKEKIKKVIEEMNVELKNKDFSSQNFELEEDEKKIHYLSSQAESYNSFCKFNFKVLFKYKKDPKIKIFSIFEIENKINFIIYKEKDFEFCKEMELKSNALKNKNDIIQYLGGFNKINFFKILGNHSSEDCYEIFNLKKESDIFVTKLNRYQDYIKLMKRVHILNNDIFNLNNFKCHIKNRKENQCFYNLFTKKRKKSEFYKILEEKGIVNFCYFTITPLNEIYIREKNITKEIYKELLKNKKYILIYTIKHLFINSSFYYKDKFIEKKSEVEDFIKNLNSEEKQLLINENKISSF